MSLLPAAARRQMEGEVAPAARRPRDLHNIGVRDSAAAAASEAAQPHAVGCASAKVAERRTTNDARIQKKRTTRSR